jgi:hypothetical protein
MVFLVKTPVQKLIACALLPVENGPVVGYLNRTTDQLGGFGASATQAMGRGMMVKQISAAGSAPAQRPEELSAGLTPYSQPH